LLCACALAACAPSQPKAPDPQETLRGLDTSGYPQAQHLEISTLKETWGGGDEWFDVALTLPAGGSGHTPLIVYLPGLGEPAAAGTLWREYWARAGYAVLSAQPAALGPAIWSSPRARSGDFYNLAKEQFDAAALPGRVKVLRYALAEISRRAANGAPPYAGIDVERVVLAGFDLGAQTAAGALSDGPLRGRVRALMLLGQVSLQTRSALANVRPLPADVQVPVLTLTGVGDNDPYEFGSGPQQRQAAWQTWPAGDKYILMLASGSHSLLAGRSVNDPDAPVPYARSPGGGTPGRSRGDHMTIGGEPSRRVEEPPPRILDLHQIAAVQNVSLASLDATVKASAAARQWLDQQSHSWLGPSGTLSAR
jgi:hypothetical protein